MPLKRILFDDECEGKNQNEFLRIGKSETMNEKDS